MGFRRNSSASRELARAASMRRYMEDVADNVAREISRRAPSMVKANGRVFGRVSGSASGWRAEAVVESPFWHWPEFGTSGRDFSSASPYIRPGAQSVLSRVGGKFKPV